MSSRPRGRPRKGDTRMDAALDAMDQYKFNPILVRRTVEELLSVYGTEGWFFIEECAYMLLIDTLLEKGKEETESEDKGNNTLTVTPPADIVASCSNMQTSDIAASCSDIQMRDTSPHTKEALESSTLENKVHDPTPLRIEGRDPTLCIQGRDPTLHINEALESATPGKEAHGPTPICIEGHGPTLLIKEALESATPGNEAHGPTPICIEGHDPTLLIKEALESATPGNEAHGPTPICIEGHDPTLLIKEALESAAPGKEVHDPASLSNIHDYTSPLDESVVKLCLPPPAEDKGRTSEDVNMEQNIQTKQTNISSDKHKAAPRTAVPPPYKLIPPPPADPAFSHLNRRPFHGWIDDDDDDDEMVELTPEPLPENLRRMLNLVDGFSAAEKKRKSRWDVKPGDGT